MEFKYYFCHCKNISIYGKKVNLQHKTALNYSTLQEIYRTQNVFPLIQINSAAIFIANWSKISIYKLSSSKYQLSCSQLINIFPSRNNCYIQFSNHTNTMKSPDFTIPPEIHKIFDFSK